MSGELCGTCARLGQTAPVVNGRPPWCGLFDKRLREARAECKGENWVRSNEPRTVQDILQVMYGSQRT